MDLIGAVVLVALLNAFAAVMWFGGWSWVVDFEPDFRRSWDVAMPWMIVGVDVMLVGVYVRRVLGLGSSVDLTFLAPGLAFMALGCVVAISDRPRWALPSWYVGRLHHGSYRPAATPPAAHTFWERARRDHLGSIAVLVPAMLVIGYYGALGGCARSVSPTTCGEAIASTTLWSLLGGIVFTAAAYRLGWISTRRGNEAERLRKKTQTSVALSVLLAPLVYALFRVSSLAREVGAYVVLDALIVVIAVMTAGRVVALVSEELRLSRT